jgi:hypothetical protein
MHMHMHMLATIHHPPSGHRADSAQLNTAVLTSSNAEATLGEQPGGLH